MSVIVCENIKSILMDKKPSIRLDEAREMLFSVIPEFRNSYGFNQKTDWHLYDVYYHTLKVIDNVPNNLPLRLAALFHDMGKPYTFKEENGIGHFPKHWEESLRIFNEHYRDFNLSKEEVSLIRNLIEYHDLRSTDENDIDNLVSVFGDDIDLLFQLKNADIKGQNPKYDDVSYKIFNEMKDLCSSKIKKKIIH